MCLPAHPVNHTFTYMDFRAATDLLGLPLADVARELGVSEALVKQARMAPGVRGYRAPPARWETTIARLLRERARAILDGAGELEE